MEEVSNTSKYERIKNDTKRSTKSQYCIRPKNAKAKLEVLLEIDGGIEGEQPCPRGIDPNKVLCSGIQLLLLPVLELGHREGNGRHRGVVRPVQIEDVVQGQVGHEIARGNNKVRLRSLEHAHAMKNGHTLILSFMCRNESAVPMSSATKSCSIRRFPSFGYTERKNCVI